MIAHVCTPALGRLRQNAWDFETCLDYIVKGQRELIVRPCLKTNKQTKKPQKTDKRNDPEMNYDCTSVIL